MRVIDGDGLDRPESVDPALAAEDLQQLAERLKPRERRFCEYLTESNGNEREALFRAWPEMRFEDSYAIHNKLRSLRRTPRVVAYIDAVMGNGAMTAALSYGAMLERLFDEANDPRTPPRERTLLLLGLTEQLWKNGVASREGFQGGGKAKESGGEGAAVPKGDADIFLDALELETMPAAIGDGS